MESFIYGFLKMANLQLNAKSVETPQPARKAVTDVRNASDVQSRNMTPLKPGGYETRIVGARNNMVGTVFPTGQHPYGNAKQETNI